MILKIGKFKLKDCKFTILKQIQHIVQINFFPDLKLVFRLCHVIQQKFQDQGTAKASSFNFKIRKSHWQISLLNILDTNKSLILHGF